MNKSEAKAIINTSKRILEMLNKLEAQLTTEKGYFQNYWGNQLRQTLTSEGYGCAPLRRAHEVLGDQ